VIEAVAEYDFTASENHTKLVFKTASDAVAVERLSISSGGSATFSSNATFGGDGYFNGGDLYIDGPENSASDLFIRADESDDSGDDWRVRVANGGVMTFGNDIASAGTYVSQLTLTPHATVASSTTTIAGGAVVAGSGGLDVSGGVITLANDETISNATNGTVAITATTTSVSGDLTVTGNDITFGNGETISNATNGTIAIDANVDFSDKVIAGYGATLQTLSGTSLTLDNDDNGTIINVTTTSGPITIQVPSGLATGFNCMIVQSGDETVTLDDNSDATTLNARNGLKTSGQYAIMTLVHIGSNVYVVSGDTKTS
jgi:hypothetical protein